MGRWGRRVVVVGVASAALAGAADLRPAVAAQLVIEEHANLDVARRLTAQLRAHGVDVRETRTGDRYVGLSERTAMARRVRADAFISVHHNAGPSSRSGTEVYRQVSGGGSLGDHVADGWRRRFPGRSVRVIARSSGRDAHRDFYAVLRTSPVPALIVEGAYLTHRGDARMAADPALRQAQAEATADGVLRWASGLGGPTPPRPFPGVRTTTTSVPPATGLRARLPDRHRAVLTWRTAPLAGGYRVYRQGHLLAEVANPSRAAAATATFEDLWVTPGTRFTYEVRAVLAPGPVAAESTPVFATVTTPRATVVVDAGHGGHDPGARGTT